jgi:hypothetical protein
MSDELVALVGIPFAAFLVWLTIRIINRRERWAMALAVLIAVAISCYGAHLYYLLTES